MSDDRTRPAHLTAFTSPAPRPAPSPTPLWEARARPGRTSAGTGTGTGTNHDGLGRHGGAGSGPARGKDSGGVAAEHAGAAPRTSGEGAGEVGGEVGAGAAAGPGGVGLGGARMRPVAVLVGLPGVGKSTVGRLMAKRLGVAFRDTDEDIERRSGMCVAQIFASYGEAVFRELERAAVHAALAGHEGVLALGGGAVLDPLTRALLTGGPVIHLDADVQEVLARPASVGARPLLATDPAARLRELAAHRAPLYRQVARVRVSTRATSAAQVTGAALRSLALTPAP
ncbi:shikimate kinase [Streptomyces sp. NPDC005574]|uniref:shikimate kinase n=1 Tax=Streptomyces sp. NPDC005574 TaxID=3156891 RepID=UPI00339EF50C